ncbi:T9SS type A sorting domain-containing protein [Kordia algicida OT-1]|uniref:Secretion system C-terminal sorting domain-containing protein n=1 Tax=Kordia algicida OT-1 TaxID=391587 RepID=A9DKJ1_9FLAO|nr:T9SS type A sorting domain-containing protein [Kordia algicida]EDP98337.1 hypothetical protein KAOT1_14007 [Kordia algicida OT-1]
MKKQLLFLVCVLSTYVLTAQSVFPDTWEFRGIHQNFSGGSTPVAPPGPNPAGLDTAVLPTANGRLSSPVLVDLDGDGDLDMVSGAQDAAGKLYYYENTGSATVPNWVQTALPTLDAISYSPGGNNETKCQFVDIDDDGDYDLFFGSKIDENNFNFNDIHYYENTGTATVPNFVDSTITGIGNQNVANFPSFGFVDLDNDDDLDMVTMGSDSLTYFRNEGTKTMPSFDRKFHLDNPWDMNAGTGVFDRNWPHGDVLTTIPNFYDVDRDGDYDMIFATDVGVIRWIENVGSESAPDFGTYTYQQLTGDLATFDFGQFATISFGDVNGDGVLDAICGAFNPGYFAWFEGVLTSPLSIDERSVVTMNVSPNPVKDILTVQFQNSQINIANLSMYTIAGQVVYNKRAILKDNAVKIDVSKLKAGLYFLKVTRENKETIIKKITVQ